MIKTSKALLGLSLLLTVVAEIAISNPIENFVCTEDVHRPRFHFSSKENWIDTPTGIVYKDGVYHMYYQHNPNDSISNTKYWGHAISQNLLTWEELPIAISAGQDSISAQISGGSVVVDSTNTSGFATKEQTEPIIAIYTNTRIPIDDYDDIYSQHQSIAYSLDNGMTFTEYANPALEGNFEVVGPKVFYSHQDKQWIILLNKGNKVEFYGSENLKEWKRVSEFGTNVSYAGEWQSSNLFPVNVAIGEKQTVEVWVLIVSVKPNDFDDGPGTIYFVGEFQNRTFKSYPVAPNQYLDFGPDNYGGIVVGNHSNGQPIFIGWMDNWLYADHTPNNGHRGQLTLPRVLGVEVANSEVVEPLRQYRLTSHPAPSLIHLRHPHQAYEDPTPFEIISQTEVDLNANTGFNSDTMELEITVDFTENSQFAICASNDLKEEVCFGYDESKWYLDRSKSGNTKFNDNFDLTSKTFADRRISDESATIRIFLDVSSIEVFVDRGLTTMTSLHFPTKPFNKFSINHWSKASSDAVVNVVNYKIWGLQCWVAQHDGNDKSGAITITPVSIAIIVFLNLFYFVFCS